ncbi:MAG TPA: S41 family peptidase [Crocinitomicaceae bacterium]|nr:S41 family peptidase [Crocinitomicaceae bacterium]
MKNFLSKGLLIGAFFCQFTFSNAQSSGFEVIKGIDLMEDVLMRLDQYYVDDPHFGDLSKKSIDAMLKELDPYTVYYHESNMEDYLLLTTGQYGGIGSVIRKLDDYTYIVEPYEGKPAFNAGLRAGDKILEIDGRSMKDEKSDNVSSKLRGPKGSEIEVKVERNGEIKTFKFKRDEIDVPVIPYYGMLSDRIGYINLNTFMKQTVTDEVAKAIKDLKTKGMTELVMDLRGNGGGFLNQAVSLVNLFVDKGTLVVSTKGRLESEVFSYVTQSEPLDKNIPVAILIDENSASASEIFAGTMQDLDRAVVIGKTSFGKGLVQRTYDLKYGAKMKLTVAKYYTNSGRCVQKLEYYDKEFGKKAKEIPDSLVKTFYTKNKRPVIDGRGIEPDIKIEEKELSNLTFMVIAKNLVFNYANQYYYKHATIDAPEKFRLTDADYNDFKLMVIKDTFDYKTESEDMLFDLKKTAEKEGYFEEVKALYEQMLPHLTPSKERDLDKFKSEIIKILEDEIISRYYFQKGRTIYQLNDNEDVKKAKEILLDKTQYNKILGR